MQATVLLNDLWRLFRQQEIGLQDINQKRYTVEKLISYITITLTYMWILINLLKLASIYTNMSMPWWIMP